MLGPYLGSFKYSDLFCHISYQNIIVLGCMNEEMGDIFHALMGCLWEGGGSETMNLCSRRAIK